MNKKWNDGWWKRQRAANAKYDKPFEIRKLSPVAAAKRQRRLKIESLQVVVKDELRRHGLTYSPQTTNRRTCSRDGCAATHCARGLCRNHYAQMMGFYKGSARRIRKKRQKYLSCTVPGCEKKHDCNGLCMAHRAKARRAAAPKGRGNGWRKGMKGGLAPKTKTAQIASRSALEAFLGRA